MTIRNIMCCCGNGVGSSMILKMTAEEALTELGMDNIEVTFGQISEAAFSGADLFIVSRELVALMPDPSHTIGMDDLMDTEEAVQKLKQFLEV